MSSGGGGVDVAPPRGAAAGRASRPLRVPAAAEGQPGARQRGALEKVATVDDRHDATRPTPRAAIEVSMRIELPGVSSTMQVLRSPSPVKRMMLKPCPILAEGAR